MPLIILVAIFIGIPILEISFLLKVSDAIGGLRTILFVIFTAVIGAYLVKQQGIATLNKFQQESNAGRIPAQQILEGIVLLFAGAVLVTPGFFTDALGFALLVPPLRRTIIAYVLNSGRFNVASFQQAKDSPFTKTSQGGNVIEGEYTDKNDDIK